MDPVKDIGDEVAKKISECFESLVESVKSNDSQIKGMMADIETILDMQNKINKRITEVMEQELLNDEKLDETDEKLGDLEKNIKENDKRLDLISKDIESLIKKYDKRFEELTNEELSFKDFREEY